MSPRRDRDICFDSYNVVVNNRTRIFVVSKHCGVELALSHYRILNIIMIIFVRFDIKIIQFKNELKHCKN